MVRLCRIAAVDGRNKRGSAFGEFGVEITGHVALVRDDREPGPVGGRGGFVLRCRDQDVAFVDLRVG